MARILVACEESQAVTKAFRALGHEAYSCDLEPCSGGHPEWHLQDDAIKVMNTFWWDLLIAHPPCTYLTVSGNRWFDVDKYGNKARERARLREEAIEFFKKFIECPNADRIAVENPIGVLSTRYRKPDQIIQPYQFGDPARKATCLWLKNLPPLVPTNIVEPELVTYKNGKGTDSKWHVGTFNLPAKERSKARSKTFPGIAQAMAEQWGATL